MAIRTIRDSEQPIPNHTINPQETEQETVNDTETVVNSVTAGKGIAMKGSATDPIIYNSGAVTIAAGAGISVSSVEGNYTIENTEPSKGGTVFAVTAGTGLVGGTITTSGEISLPPTGVAPATYTNPTLTVDSHGRVTFITNGLSSILFSGAAPIVVTGSVISANLASSNAPGVVQLTDSVFTNSSNLAATATAVKTAYDLAYTSVQKATWGTPGDLVVASGPSVPSALPLGGEGQFLKVCNACASTGGVTWGNPEGVSGTYAFGQWTVVVTNGIITSIT
jgi:hypothetical protein